jgi:hypothetical protein
MRRLFILLLLLLLLHIEGDLLHSGGSQMKPNVNYGIAVDDVRNRRDDRWHDRAVGCPER